MLTPDTLAPGHADTSPDRERVHRSLFRLPSRRLALSVLLVLPLATASACGDDDSADGPAQPTGAAAAGDPATDKLAQVLARGTLILSTDLKYPPQSFEVKGAKRAAGSSCAANQRTAPEVGGYDADTAKLVAKALGVEPCFVTPSWTEITAGKWSDRWDIAYGSGAITEDRMTRLWMTAPYRAEAQRFYVHEDAPYTRPADLDGKRIGVCASCSVEAYLKDELELPGVQLTAKVKRPKIVAYDIDPPGLEDLGRGELAGYACNENVGKQAIEDGLPLRALHGDAFEEYLTGFVDRSSGLDVGPFIKRINQIVERLHADGELRRLSVKYFGRDYASRAATFDLGAIGQRAGS
jgi:polar amino acid transport system substrate-binding protein